jgi:hypothetical protein
MVINNYSFEEQLLRLISATKAELEAKEKDYHKLIKEIQELTLEKEGYEKALSGYQRRFGIPGQAEINWNELLKDADTHKEKIIVITKYLGGSTRPNQLTDILYNQGFIKSKKRANAYLIISRILIDLVDKRLMEKTDTGEYRLLGAQPNLPLNNVNSNGGDTV